MKIFERVDVAEGGAITMPALCGVASIFAWNHGKDWKGEYLGWAFWLRLPSYGVELDPYLEQPHWYQRVLTIHNRWNPYPGEKSQGWQGWAWRIVHWRVDDIGSPT